MVDIAKIQEENLRELSDNYVDAREEYTNRGMLNTFGISFDERKELAFLYVNAQLRMIKAKRLLDEYMRKI